jgi:hypothetical protein
VALADGVNNEQKSSIVTSQTATLSWQLIDAGEASSIEWINGLTNSELLALGDMRQQSEALMRVRAFYPYLLPDNFFNRNMDLTCYPTFLSFRTQRDQESFSAWRQCIGELWRSEPPSLIAQALKDLKP